MNIKVAQDRKTELDSKNNDLDERIISQKRKVNQLETNQAKYTSAMSSGQNATLSSYRNSSSAAAERDKILEISEGSFARVGLNGDLVPLHLTQLRGTTTYRGPKDELVKKVLNNEYEFRLDGSRLILGKEDETYLANLDDIIFENGELKEVVVRGKNIQATKLSAQSRSAITDFVQSGKTNLDNKLKSERNVQRMIASEKVEVEKEKAMLDELLEVMGAVELK